MVAAEECAFLFEPMTDDMDSAISTGGSERMDRALKAIEGVGRAVHAYLKRLVVVISAGFADRHDVTYLAGTFATMNSFDGGHLRPNRYLNGFIDVE